MTAAHRREAVALGAVLVLAAALRLLWVRWFPMAPESDYATFLDMARRIAAGEWLPASYGWVYQGVGYPTLIAPLLWLGYGLDAVRMVNVLAQLGMVVGVWALARRLFGPRGALLAAILAAVSPGLWGYVPLLAAESVAMLLLIVVASLLAAPGPIWRSGLLGVVMAALALTRPSFLPFVLLVAGATGLLGRNGRRRLLLFGVGLLLVAAPVMALNRAHDGPLLPVGASGWQTWLVNNEHATGSWFDAYADDAYPFRGLTGDEEIRAAQSKLGIQFVVANPIAAVEGALDRYRLNWRSDGLGIGWTFDRAPTAWRDRVPFASHLHGAVPVLYLALLVLAATGAVRNRRRAALLLPIGLPLGYAMAILALAEANARYHAVFIPLLCVMAGGALVPRTRVRGGGRPDDGERIVPAGSQDGLARWIQGRLVLLLSWAVVLLSVALLMVAGPGRSVWSWARTGLPPWLVAAVVVAPLVGCGAAWLRSAWPEIVRRAAWPVRPSRCGLIAAGLSATVVVAAVWFAGAMVARTRAELAAVSPSGWTRTVVPASTDPLAGPGAPGSFAALPMPLILVDSGTDPDLRQVSFPDAALLGFDAPPRFGDTVQLTRMLTGLRVGETYVFTLQVYDPGTDGDLTDRLRITLNGTTVWERRPGRVTPSGWQYVRVAWTADAPTLDLAVAHVAGWRYRPDTIAVPRVRTLHLYPRY